MTTAAGGHAGRDAERYRALKTASTIWTSVNAELQASYYLSGSRKRIDIAALPGFGDLAAQVQAEGRAGMHLDLLLHALAGGAARAGRAADRRGGRVSGRLGEVRRRELSRARTGAGVLRLRHVQRPRPYDDARDDIRHRTGGKFLDTSAARVGEYLAGYPNVELVVGDIMETAPARFAGVPAFALVHVDVDVYPPTEFCLRFFAPRLAPGALLVVDDYGFTTCPGAKTAVGRIRGRASRVHHGAPALGAGPCVSCRVMQSDDAMRQEQDRRERKAALVARRVEVQAAKQREEAERAERRQAEAAQLETERLATAATATRASRIYRDVRARAARMRDTGGGGVERTPAEVRRLAQLAPLWDAGPDTIGSLRRACAPISGVRADDYAPPSPELTVRLKQGYRVLRSAGRRRALRRGIAGGSADSAIAATDSCSTKTR